ncbi:MAG: hypothetical protein OXG04_10825 [Acidobacteria bacterium]|nr:hypothetical protein [Acidobacteriota bacterium]
MRITLDGQVLALGGIAEKVLARAAAAWAASSCRLGTPGTSTRISTTASGARSSSTTSRGPRSWVDLALHREEVASRIPSSRARIIRGFAPNVTADRVSYIGGDPVSGRCVTGRLV